MRQLCEFVVLPARWREAGAAGNPQCHPGLGKPGNHSPEAVFWNRSAEHLSHQSCVDRGGRNLTTWLQARCWSSSRPQTSGCSILLAKAGQFSFRALYPAERSLGLSCLRRGGAFWFAGLGFSLTLDKGSIGLTWRPRQS